MLWRKVTPRLGIKSCFLGQPAYSPGATLTKLPKHKLVSALVEANRCFENTQSLMSVNQPLMVTEDESELQSKNRAQLGDSLYSVVLPAMSIAKYMIINLILSHITEK
jgi:hypothetical protein